MEGKLGGYSLGHDAGRLAVAYAQLPDAPATVERLSSRLGQLATGIISPSSVAERLGWALGCSDRTLVQTIHWRLERARLALQSTAAVPSQIRRAA